MTNINETNRKPDAQFGDTTHDSVNTANANNVVHLDQNDPSKPDVDAYLNNQLSNGDIVCIDPGEHVVTQIDTQGFVFTLFWRGTLIPDGDHPVIRMKGGSGTSYIIDESRPDPGDASRFGFHVDTRPVAGFSSDAVVFSKRVVTSGTLRGRGPARYGFYFTVDGATNENLVRSHGRFSWDGRDDAGNPATEVGMMWDGDTDMNTCRMAFFPRYSTQFGAFINSGAGNKFWISADSNDGAPFGFYDRDHATYGSGTLQHSNTTAFLYADSNNVGPAEFSSEVHASDFRGLLSSGVTGSVSRTSTLTQGGVFGEEVGGAGYAIDNNWPTFADGFVMDQRGPPDTAELPNNGQAIAYLSDGTEHGVGDLVMAWNNGGAINTLVVADRTSAA